ncbi:MAG TPA: hypothetical protein VFQ13_24725 [Anaerolineales bacterium]|nr:hypothetical protein [Anaerolineales bacterium]
MEQNTGRKNIIFTCVLILILLLPVTLAAPVLEGFFSANELDEMGIRLGTSMECSQAGD